MSKRYIITSNYQVEVEADSPEEAIEKHLEEKEEELIVMNSTFQNEFVETLEAEELPPQKTKRSAKK